MAEQDIPEPSPCGMKETGLVHHVGWKKTLDCIERYMQCNQDIIHAVLDAKMKSISEEMDKLIASTYDDLVQKSVEVDKYENRAKARETLDCIERYMQRKQNIIHAVLKAKIKSTSEEMHKLIASMYDDLVQKSVEMDKYEDRAKTQETSDSIERYIASIKDSLQEIVGMCKYDNLVQETLYSIERYILSIGYDDSVQESVEVDKYENLAKAQEKLAKIYKGPPSKFAELDELKTMVDDCLELDKLSNVPTVREVESD